jgi:4-amino-4-deoxy-L-arabinose transferase-like glycosyltransferase
MRFFLYEVVARIVAIYLCFDCGRKLRYGLAERKIAYFNSNFLNWSNWVAHRDAAPVQYWIQIGIQIILAVSCLFVAIFGWWQPNA